MIKCIENKDLDDLCELIQDDIICILDGADVKVIDNLCDAVVNRIGYLKKQAAK